MQAIGLKGVIPVVFNGQVPSDPVSDVWGTDLLFERGNSYLIKAASGRGKSSLCSYIFGLRDDYEGVISFDGRPIHGYARLNGIIYARTSLECFSRTFACSETSMLWKT